MSKWLVWAYAGILMIYCGWRTMDFMSSNLPKTDISFWLSIIFLFCTEIGLLMWHGLNLKSVTTETQDKVSSVMTWVDFVGSFAAGVADMILRQTFLEGYTIPLWLADFLMYGLPAIVAANVAMVIIYTGNDAKTLEEKAEKRAKFAIHAEAMRQIDNDRENLANEKADVIYSRIRGRVTGHVDGAYGGNGAVYHRPALPERKPSLLGLVFRGLTAKATAPLARLASSLDNAPRQNAYAQEVQAHIGGAGEGGSNEPVTACSGWRKYDCKHVYSGTEAPRDWLRVGGRRYCPDCEQKIMAELQSGNQPDPINPR